MAERPHRRAAQARGGRRSVVFEHINVDGLFILILNGVRPDSNVNCCNAERLCNFGDVNA